ncbi:hypothetical protein D3C87_1434320 [compost metagenome]
MPGVVAELRAETRAFDDRSGGGIYLLTGDARPDSCDGGELCLKYRLVNAVERMVLLFLALPGDKECPRHVRTIPLVLGAKIECDHLAGGNHFVRGFTVW